jgi:hypothetical protein
MMLAHLAGVPFEEWFAPLVATGSGMALGLRAAFRRLHERPDAATVATTRR